MPDARLKVKHRLCVDRNLWKPFLANAQAETCKIVSSAGPARQIGICRKDRLVTNYDRQVVELGGFAASGLP